MKFQNLIGLRARIFLTLGALVLITVGGGMVMIWYTYRMETLLTSVISINVASLQAAKGLETALLNQRGYVSYYILEGDPAWLQELGKHRQAFDERLREARALDRSDTARETLDKIEAEYTCYTKAKDEVIAFYKAGQREAGSDLHRRVRDRFFEVLALCEEYNELHRVNLIRAWAHGRTQAERLRLIAGSGMTAAVVIGALLSFFLVNQVLDPIRRLARETRKREASSPSGDEMASLQSGVRGLIEDVDHTHLELERSRAQLMQSEKMATVGKLAAEVAHSIRNPLTSIKMRLFSLERNLELPPAQREDIEVISEEMHHLDNIVRNFLEFSRAPQLKVQMVAVSEVMDMTLQLLEKRLERNNVQVERDRRQPLPRVEADPELLKEVFVNLIVNACDAMPLGGKLVVKEEEALAEGIGRAVLIRLRDTGPGIPESIQESIFDPFFSTKDEGTGLGLSIAARIVNEHGGRLEVRSQEGQGTTFIVTLPVGEEDA